MEVCVDNVESALNAFNGGAMRLELCSALSEGGLTPSVGMLQVIKKLISIPVFVMIRPRSGDDFIYSENENEIMRNDIKLLKENGADGFVFGILTTDKNVNECACKVLLDVASPLPVTFHRAFDVVNKPLHALETIINLGFKRLLTSGQADTAEKGLCLIKELISAAKNRIIIMPGSGVNEKNLSKILTETNVKEFHGSAKRSHVISENSCEKDNSIGISKQPDLWITDLETVKKMVKIAENNIAL